MKKTILEKSKCKNLEKEIAELKKRIEVLEVFRLTYSHNQAFLNFVTVKELKNYLKGFRDL